MNRPTRLSAPTPSMGWKPEPNRVLASIIGAAVLLAAVTALVVWLSVQIVGCAA